MTSESLRAADAVDWSQVYPQHCRDGKLEAPIDYADVGCGFGGLLMELGKNFPKARYRAYSTELLSLLHRMHASKNASLPTHN